MLEDFFEGDKTEHEIRDSDFDFWKIEAFEIEEIVGDCISFWELDVIWAGLEEKSYFVEFGGSGCDFFELCVELGLVVQEYVGLEENEIIVVWVYVDEYERFPASGTVLAEEFIFFLAVDAKCTVAVHAFFEIIILLVALFSNNFNFILRLGGMDIQFLIDLESSRFGIFKEFLFLSWLSYLL